MKIRGFLAIIAFYLMFSSSRVLAQGAINLSYDGDGNLVSKTVNE
jgi:hypothetical protein